MARRSKRADGGGRAVERRPAGAVRVLVVNDEPEACELLVRVLGRSGNEVERTRDRAAMTDRLADQPPLDCIVLDVSAADSGGNLKLLDAVRSSRDNRSAATPVVLVANAASSAMFSWQAGVDELLVRPFHADELVAAVANAVERAEEERPRHRRRQLDAAKANGRPMPGTPAPSSTDDDADRSL